MADRINTALVGYGYAGKTFHAPLIAACEGLALHTIVSSRPDAVLADWPGCRVAATLEQALADPAVALVVIASPNDQHFPQARAALLAGKHVVVDKPFTVTLAEAEALQRLAEEQGRLLSVFHNRRWDADFLQLRALLLEGQLGAISHFESHFDRYRPQVRARWREQDIAGAGLWFDLGPHLLDQALCLFGQPEGITAHLARQREGAQAVDYAHVHLRYPAQSVVLHASCLVSGGSPRYLVHGSKASFVKYGLDTQEGDLKQGKLPGHPAWGLDIEPGCLLTQENDLVSRQDLPAPTGDYRQYYQSVASAVNGHGGNPVPAEQALSVMRWLSLGVLSDAQRRETRLTDLPALT